MTPVHAPLRRLLHFLRPYAWWVVAGVLLSFATIGSSVGLMAVSAYLISKAAVATDVTQLSLAIAGVRLFALTRAGFRYAERYLTHLATFRILTALRVWFYRAIEPLAPARLQSLHSGDLLARIVADIGTLENFYVRVTIPPLVAVLVTVLACAILGVFDVWLALALLLFLLLTGVALPAASHWLSRQSAASVVEARAALHAAVVDTVQGMPDIVANGQETNQQARLLRLNDDLNQVQERLARVRGLAEGLAALFTSLAALAVFGLAIPLVTTGRVDGVYLALLPLTAIASFEAVQPLARAFQELDVSRTAATRLYELVDADPAVNDPPAPLPVPASPTIEVHNLRFRYAAGEPWVLDGLDLRLAPGEVVHLSGPSGSGKTTLVNLLLRFWDYDEGQILLDGRDIGAYRADDVRAAIAVVAQHTHLFNTSVRDNLLLANPDATEAEMIAVCRQVQLHDVISSLPAGYDTRLGENGFRLSGGERQRLAIARALLKGAPILILDEATAHLDPLTEQAVLHALAQFAVGRATLIISHAPMPASSIGLQDHTPGVK